MAGSLSGWISYTFSVSRKIMNSIFEEGRKEYFTNWDRTHKPVLFGSYQFNKNGKSTGDMLFNQSFTPILGYYLQKFLKVLNKSPGQYQELVTLEGTSSASRLDLGAVYHTNIAGKKIDFFFQIINTFNRKNTFRKVYDLGNANNGLDDDNDWEKDKHDANGNGKPDPGEVNVDKEPDEGIIRERNISLFPIIPTFGFTWSFLNDV